MELEQLKTWWQDAGSAETPLSEEELQQMLRRRSQHPIARMKRNLLLEVIFLVITYSSLIVYLEKINHDVFLPYNIFLVVIAVLFFAYAFHKYRLLHQMQCVACEVKSNLQQQVNSLEKLVKLYFYAGNVLTFIAFTFAGIITLLSRKAPAGNVVAMPGIVPVAIFLGIGALLTLVVYFINRWYVFKLYGQHIQKLKNILHEMEETHGT